MEFKLGDRVQYKFVYRHNVRRVIDGVQRRVENEYRWIDAVIVEVLKKSVTIELVNGDKRVRKKSIPITSLRRPIT